MSPIRVLILTDPDSSLLPVSRVSADCQRPLPPVFAASEALLPQPAVWTASVSEPPLVQAASRSCFHGDHSPKPGNERADGVHPFVKRKCILTQPNPSHIYFIRRQIHLNVQRSHSEEVRSSRKSLMFPHTEVPSTTSRANDGGGGGDIHVNWVKWDQQDTHLLFCVSRSLRGPPRCWVSAGLTYHHACVSVCSESRSKPTRWDSKWVSQSEWRTEWGGAAEQVFRVGWTPHWQQRQLHQFGLLRLQIPGQ